MILVCAADDFRKFRKNLENYQFLKIHKKSVISKMLNVWCFFKSTGQVCNHLYLNSIKTALKTLIFLKNDFCIFEPKNREVNENTSKTPLCFSPLQCTYLGKNSFHNHLGLVRKKKLKSGYLELRFSVLDKKSNKKYSFCISLNQSQKRATTQSKLCWWLPNSNLTPVF